MSKFIKLARLAMIPCLLSMVWGCATVQGDRGSRATLSPGWDRIKQSARDAAASPHTWGPLIGAALFGISDFDEETVEWATKETPLFEGIEDAEDKSDLLSDLSTLNYAITTVAVPSRTVGEKAKGIAIGVVGGGINDALTQGIKSATGRTRPDERSDNSFPSQHMSGSIYAATLAVKNLEHIPIDRRGKRVWQWTSYAVAGLTGWARVEGKRHFPSDVLAGYALGHFLGAFINDAFIEPGGGDGSALRVEVDPEGKLLVNFYRTF